MTFDDMLRQAFEETARERAEHPRKVYKKHRFSLAFKLWEFKTLRNLKNNRFNGRWTLRKARRAVIAMIAAVSTAISGYYHNSKGELRNTGYGNQSNHYMRVEATRPSDSICWVNVVSNHHTPCAGDQKLYWSK